MNSRILFCYVLLGVAAFQAGLTSTQAQVLAQSISEFSGTQGQNGWFNGYRNYTLTGETQDYDPQAGFIPYAGGAGMGAFNGTTQQWNGSASPPQWDLTTSGAPFTFQAAQNIQPNGANSAPNQEHWPIRRWVANELNAETTLDVVWHVRKGNTAGNGVTGGVWINGKKIEAVSIEASDTMGVTVTNTVKIKPKDIVDLVLTPEGPDGDRNGTSDNAVNWMRIAFPAIDTDEDTFIDDFETLTGHKPNDPNDHPIASAIANSIDEFSGVQGENDWFHGYRNINVDGQGKTDYNAQTAFIRFTDEEWRGGAWDVNTGSSAPWTELGRQTTHPNGSNSGQVHWTIRRWVATEITKPTPVALHWHVRKTNIGGGGTAGGNGVTGSLHINGKEVDKLLVGGIDNSGQIRTYYANLNPGDIIDLALRPTGIDGGDNDGQDGSANWLLVDTTLPPNPIQPNGTVFIAVGASDSDNDGIPDVWERIFFPTDLTKLSRTGDADSDGLADLGEYERDTDPTKSDTDSDGLSDRVETGTGRFVSANDTGSSPKKPDTDGDGRNDRDEVLGTPTTDPNRIDTDGDSFSDPDEIAEGTDPNDKSSNVLMGVIANSIAEFSGVQGTNGWFNGYRNYTLDGPDTNYNAVASFIPYKGSPDLGPWDGEAQQWTGSVWDLNTAAAGPWTTQGPQDTHPNGENSAPNEEHWTIRRWVATEISKVTPVAIIWQVRKTNLAGDGVTGALFLNGTLLDTVTIAGNNGTNPARRYYLNLNPNDVVDLALTPQGVSNRGDGSDGSVSWFWVDTRIPPNPRQLDGTAFVPAGGGSAVRIQSTSFDAVQRRISFTWASLANAKYTIESSSDLRTWTVVRADVASGGATTTFSDAVDLANPARFYRIRQ